MERGIRKHDTEGGKSGCYLIGWDETGIQRSAAALEQDDRGCRGLEDLSFGGRDFADGLDGLQVRIHEGERLLIPSFPGSKLADTIGGIGPDHQMESTQTFDG